MSDYKIGDIVARKSYGADITFEIADVIRNDDRDEQYLLKGLFFRLAADSDESDLIKVNSRTVHSNTQKNIFMLKANQFFNRLFRNPYLFNMQRRRPGKILHVDGSRSFLNTSMMYYRSRGLRPVGVYVDEPDQPQAARSLLSQHNPDIVVFTGHDGLSKDATDVNSFESYTYSRYYAQTVREARAYQPNSDNLFIFAGACQSYYEALVSAGATYASSPSRVLIHSVDPAIVASRFAITSQNRIITPNQAVRGTYAGTRGIGGVSTRGRLTTA
ncbi:sporulation peptidase YabG [Herbivorax sp. ANBcel31]|uniref:sporulation peptidase YabG n=1 Tax=Herbivorax sp. ANBcel31 TaxID=3069754 RepID=UPI0027AF11E4|nr:sporulation peptidase YabG [Herbivorax sp. ANBcel31]MDQ2086846.1 sporulation peptidase YabG [Herbivorax sp. ANBcel31]